MRSEIQYLDYMLKQEIIVGLLEEIQEKLSGNGEVLIFEWIVIRGNIRKIIEEKGERKPSVVL